MTVYIKNWTEMKYADIPTDKRRDNRLEYQVTSMFVNHREQILRRLLEE